MRVFFFCALGFLPVNGLAGTPCRKCLSSWWFAAPGPVPSLPHLHPQAHALQEPQCEEEVPLPEVPQGLQSSCTPGTGASGFESPSCTAIPAPAPGAFLAFLALPFLLGFALPSLSLSPDPA